MKGEHLVVSDEGLPNHNKQALRLLIEMSLNVVASLEIIALGFVYS